MRIAVIGGTGLIGSRLVARLEADGHDVVAASRATGVNSYTGEGLSEALAGVETLIDVSNSGYLDERGANDFFYGSTLNLLSHGAAAGVRHHVALSVVGTDRLARTEGGYFAAKAAQERLIRQSAQPYTIVHATQFFEFIASIADAATRHHVVRLSHALIQPIAADDVAMATASVALGEPVNGTVEFARPRAVPARGPGPTAAARAPRSPRGRRRSARAVLRHRPRRARAASVRGGDDHVDEVSRLARDRRRGVSVPRTHAHSRGE